MIALLVREEYLEAAEWVPIQSQSGLERDTHIKQKRSVLTLTICGMMDHQECEIESETDDCTLADEIPALFLLLIGSEEQTTHQVWTTMQVQATRWAPMRRL